jgi:hypothetical protein
MCIRGCMQDQNTFRYTQIQTSSRSAYVTVSVCISVECENIHTDMPGIQLLWKLNTYRYMHTYTGTALCILLHMHCAYELCTLLYVVHILDSQCICVCINFTYIQDKTVHICGVCVCISGTYARALSLILTPRLMEIEKAFIDMIDFPATSSTIWFQLCHGTDKKSRILRVGAASNRLRTWRISSSRFSLAIFQVFFIGIWDRSAVLGVLSEYPSATFICLRCDSQETMRSCSGPSYAPQYRPPRNWDMYSMVGWSEGPIFPGSKSDFFGVLIISTLG